MALTKTSLLNITNQVLQKIGEAAITDVSTASTGMAYIVLNYIDDTLYDIYSRGNFSFMQQEFTNDGTYTLEWTTNVRKLTIPDEINENFITGLVLVTGAAGSEDDTTTASTLAYQEFDQFIKDHPYDEGGNGVPTTYSIFLRTIYVYPTPTANTYSVKVYSTKNVDKLSRVNATTLDLPLRFEYILEAGVLWRFYTGRDVNAAQQWRQTFEDGLRSMLAQYSIQMTHDGKLK